MNVVSRVSFAGVHGRLASVTVFEVSAPSGKAYPVAGESVTVAELFTHALALSSTPCWLVGKVSLSGPHSETCIMGLSAGVTVSNGESSLHGNVTSAFWSTTLA